MSALCVLDLGEYSQKRYKKLVSRVELHSSAVSCNGYRNRSQHRKLALEKKRSTEQRKALHKSGQPTKQRGKLQRTSHQTTTQVNKTQGKQTRKVT